MEQQDLSNESRSEKRKRETRQKIMDTAMVLFNSQGFNNTTMEQIAEEADIARKTLYNHFPVKEAIVDEYVKGISQGLAQQTFAALQELPDTRSRLLSALNKAYDWVEANPEITAICLGHRLKNIYQGSRYSSADTGTQSIMAEIIRQGQLAGEIRRDVSVKLMVVQLDILRGTIVLEWLSDSSQFELRQGMASVVDLFLNGATDREDSKKE